MLIKFRQVVVVRGRAEFDFLLVSQDVIQESAFAVFDKFDLRIFIVVIARDEK